LAYEARDGQAKRGLEEDWLMKVDQDMLVACLRLTVVFAASWLTATAGAAEFVTAQGASSKDTNAAPIKDYGDEWDARELRLIENAYRAIPSLREFANLFPTNVDYTDVEVMRPPKGPPERHRWTIETCLYGRHVLRMQVPFEADSTLTNVLSHDPPTVTLLTFDVIPGSTDPIPMGRFTLSASQWETLVATKGNLASIGFKGWTNRPIERRVMFVPEWWHWHEPGEICCWLRSVREKKALGLGTTSGDDGSRR
jgi:hypothetical protein